MGLIFSNIYMKQCVLNPVRTNSEQLQGDWFTDLPDAALIREQQIVASPKNKAPLINVSASTWWRMVRAKLAPQPIRLSPGCTVWKVGELRSWLKGLK